MAEPDNIVLEHLRAIREDVQQIRAEQRDQRMRLASIERILSHQEHETAELRVVMNARFDRVHDRLDRIERRLNLADAPN